MTPRLRQLRARQLYCQRGFTLVEMMISMMAGLIISAAAFLMARNATAFFQHEAGITAAQYSAMMGFSRLQADIRSAGFMSTPNIAVDPRLCGGVAGLLPGMQNLAGVRFEQDRSYINGTAQAKAAWDLNGPMRPDSMIIGGALGTSEQFHILTLVGGGGGGAVTVVLDNDDGAMVRTKLAAAPGTPDWNIIFRAGRMLRVVDHEGHYAFGVITGVNPGPPNVEITLAAAPVLPVREDVGADSCGCDRRCVGGVVNPVSRVRYDLRNVNPATYPQYQGLYAQATHGADAFHRGAIEPGRTELVRVELDANNAEIPATLEVLAEYAVDLEFALVRETGMNPLGFPNLERLQFGNANIYATTAATPEMVRAVTVRLSTRAHKSDREVQTVTAADGGLYRFNLGANAGFARMRTLIADVQLANQSRDPLLQ